MEQSWEDEANLEMGLKVKAIGLKVQLFINNLIKSTPPNCRGKLVNDPIKLACVSRLYPSQLTEFIYIFHA